MKKTGFWIAIVIFLGLISLAALSLVQKDNRGGTAIVRCGGETLYTIDLNTVKESYSFAVEGKNSGHNKVSVEKGRICVSEADCPDQVCVRQGWISSAGTPIVCLPHGLVIEITGGEDGPDAIIK